MYLFISIILFLNAVILWLLLIGAKKAETDEEKFVEDNLQMKYLKEFSLKKHKN